MPPAYTPTQKTAISQFTSFTQADSKTAARVLKSHNWNLEAAINDHLEHGGSAQNAPVKNALGKLFDKYRDSKQEPDTIGTEGTMHYFQDIGVDLEGVDVLVASELLQCEIMGEIKRANFIDGWASTQADTLPKQKALLANRKASLAHPSSGPLFHAIYKHTWLIARPSPSAKIVALDAAIINWRTLFTPPARDWRSASTPWLEWWCEFCEQKWKRGVNRDMWEQLGKFAEESLKDEGLGWYSDEGAWPSVVDEFVGFVKERRGDGGQGKGDGGGEGMDVE
ncbi:MAG: Scaffold-type E3 ligase [Bathelium mastoideum]|nr:MAG: Scaffold-type E3 ligase [Bathelium mastoideum]KAI9687808.1 MAG: Scaffold-type E3 ligase [Bathelium mastoideum]